MKTRDRILSVSLDLFNEEGEGTQSAVDIANALNISPGNLYYHFKGKDAIIRALFDQFEEEMRVILRGSAGRIASIKDNWIYTYIILEEIYDFRFFYRELGPLLERYPDLASRFRALLSEKRGAIAGVLDGLTRAGRLSMDTRLRAPLIDQMLQTMTFWLSGDDVQGLHSDGGQLMHRTVFQMMVLVAPYMGRGGFEAISALLTHYEAD